MQHIRENAGANPKKEDAKERGLAAAGPTAVFADPLITALTKI